MSNECLHFPTNQMAISVNILMIVNRLSYKCSSLHFNEFHWQVINITYPDSKVNGANMGPTWALSAPDGPLHPHEPCYLGFYRRQEANPPPDLGKCIRPGKVTCAGVFVIHFVDLRVSVYSLSKALRCAVLKHSVNNHYAFGNSKNPN